MHPLYSTQGGWINTDSPCQILLLDALDWSVDQ